MEKYDVVIIGAGPAGGQCARELAQKHFKVLLIDKAKNFQENNYSSGGAPLELLSDFALPESVIGSYWDILRIQSTQSNANWISSSPFGPVLDFDKLRAFLANETIKAGSDFEMGCQYQSHHYASTGVEVILKNLVSGLIFSVQTTLLVDATGSDRKVLAKDYDKMHSLIATGIEYHIQVDQVTDERYKKSLNFFLGHHWMPQGYAWIFPLSPGQLKVGVIRYFQNKTYLPYEPSYQFYLQRLLEQCGSYQILNKHGKTICYTKKQKDKRFEGPLLAIGDAISSVNPLGWEGIRHAMVSGRLAAQTIQQYLNKDIADLSPYHSSLNRYFGYKWRFTEKMTSYLFKNKKDHLIDKIVHSFNLMNDKEIKKVIFDYQFKHTIKSFFWYFVSRFKEK